MPNFSPVFAALMFGGAQLKRRDVIWYPVALLAVSDFVLTTLVYRMRMGWGQSIIWLSFAVVALVGYWLRKHESVGGVGFAALAGPTVFFVVSNFGAWLNGHMYQCYVAALPFYRNSLLATVVYTAVLFGANEIYCRRHDGIATAAHAHLGSSRRKCMSV